MFEELMQSLARVDAPNQGAPATQDGPDIVVTGKREPNPNTRATAAPMITAPPEADGGAGTQPNMFTEMPQILDAQVGDVNKAGNNLSSVFDQVSAGLQANSDQKLSVATAAVAAKKSINDGITAKNTEILGEVAPLFAERQAIADRRGALKDMNPIKRTIFGIFDKNYSDESLAHREQVVDDQLSSRGQEFETLNAITGRLLAAASGNAEGEMSLLDLKSENLNQDLSLAGTNLQFKRALLSDSLAAVGAKTEVTRAQMLLAEQQLGSLDAKTGNRALAEAAKNGGRVMVNGAELSTAQIKDRMNQLERQALALTAAQQDVTSGALRIRQQKMELAETGKRQLVSNMNIAETNQALQNGGVFKGVKLDSALLSNRLGILNQGVDAMVEYGNGANQVRAVGQAAGRLGDQTAFMTRRVAQMFGRNAPPEFVNFMHGVTQQLAQTQETIKNTNGPAAGKQIGAMLPGIQAALAQGDKLIDKLAQRMTRDPDAQIAIGTYIKGGQLTQEQATRSVIAFANGGGLPPGVKLGGPVASAMAAGNKAMAAVTQSDDYKRADAKGKERILHQAVGRAIGANWTGGVTDRIQSQLPEMAAAMGDEFGKRISPEQFRAARAAGDSAGLERLTSDFNTKYGTNFDSGKMTQLFGGGQKAVLAEINKGKSQDQQVTANQVAEIRQQLVTYQTSAWMQQMDQIGGRGTSQAFANFLRRDDVQSRIGNYADSLGQRGFGEALADSMSPGGVRGNFGNAADLINRVVASNEGARLTSTRALIGQYHNDPVNRAGVILSNIDGLSQHDRAVAQGVIREAIGNYGSSEMPSGGSAMIIGTGPRAPEAANQAIEQAVMNTSYKDPGLKRIMRTVAQNWQAASMGTDRIMGRLGSGEHK